MFALSESLLEPPERSGRESARAPEAPKQPELDEYRLARAVLRSGM